jgi:thiol:disulfide interchange protein DsbD
MVCDESQCLPPDFSEFSFTIKGVEEVVQGKNALIFPQKKSEELELNDKGASNTEKENTNTEEITSDAVDNGEDLEDKESFTEKARNTDTDATPLEELDNEEDLEDKESSDKIGWLGLFLMGLGGGFLAFFMPCTFPMIPMTVSFFTKQSKTKSEGIRNAILYGISIIIIYVIVGVGVSAIFGSDVANRLGNSIYFNIGFAIILLIFGVSFLGAFEITLPSSWVNKSDKAADKGGYIGIFFMALTLVLVSFSCTGPLVGIILVKSASGELLHPIIGMLGFSIAVAIPFVIFALSPNLLNSLPKSGGWLNSLKVVLGLLELAFAFYYLSKADLLDGEAFLKREMFITIWIMIFACITFYLLGFFKFAHDSDVKHLSVTRFSFAFIFGIYTIHMIPALWGAPANLMFGLPPDVNMSYSHNGVGNSYYEDNEQDLLDEIEEIKLMLSQSNSSVTNLFTEELTKKKELKEKRELGPQRIKVFHDYYEGVEYAKLVNKPIVVDFTGYACINCRQMESNVWSDPEIKKILKSDVVLISLHVDATKKLPKDQQYETTLAGKTKKVRTIGDKWMVLQANTYGTNSQPYYVFLNHKEETLIENANYQDYGSVDLFKDWLNRGLKEFLK